MSGVIIANKDETVSITAPDIYGANFKISIYSQTDQTWVLTNQPMTEYIDVIITNNQTVTSTASIGDTIVSISDASAMNVGDVIKIKSYYYRIIKIDINNITLHQALKENVVINDTANINRAVYSVGNSNANFIMSNGTIRTNNAFAYENFLNYAGLDQTPNTVILSDIILEGSGDIDVRDCRNAIIKNLRDLTNSVTIFTGKYQSSPDETNISISNSNFAFISVINAMGHVNLNNVNINKAGNTSIVFSGNTIPSSYMSESSITNSIINGATVFNGNQGKGMLNVDSSTFNCPTGSGVNFLRYFRVAKFNNNIIRFNRLDAPMNISNSGSGGQLQKGNTIVRGPSSTNGRGITTDAGFEAVDNDISYDWEHE